jgi:glutaredoxin
MRGTISGSGSARILICALLLAAGLIILAGCMATSPQGGGAAPAVTPTPTGLQSKIVHVPGNDHGTIVLVGRSTCPWCAKDKELLANLSVDYYWVDLNILDQAETAQVMSALTTCSDTSGVPILLINGQKCIVGYQEAQIREALA